MRILFATPECAPLAKTGGLADVSSALPAALRRLGLQVRILMPAYGSLGSVQGRLLGLHHLPALPPWPAVQLLHMEHDDGNEFLLLSAPALYARQGTPYGPGGSVDHTDNAPRFALLARVAALIGSPATPCGWQAQVVHANDWTCGLAPLYLRQLRANGVAAARSVLTLHNLAFQGIFPMPWAQALEVRPEHQGVDGVEF